MASDTETAETRLSGGKQAGNSTARPGIPIPLNRLTMNIAIIGLGGIGTTFEYSIYSNAGSTVVTEKPWDSIFSSAGINSALEPQMQAYLSTHAALVCPIMCLAGNAKGTPDTVSWGQAMQAARAMHQGFALSRKLGEPIVPRPLLIVYYSPAVLVAGLLWAVGRSGEFVMMKQLSTGEPRALIDAMVAQAGGASDLDQLVAIKPPAS